MAKIKFIQFDGTETVVEADQGTSVKDAALDNLVPGIDADCGGQCSCATCHVYVDPEWLAKLAPPDPQEDGMLDCVLDRRPNSRLSCQIEVREDLDGLVVQVPEAQI